jgi:hypothetical protein
MVGFSEPAREPGGIGEYQGRHVFVNRHSQGCRVYAKSRCGLRAGAAVPTGAPASARLYYDSWGDWASRLGSSLER